jgi:hypothetical protein
MLQFSKMFHSINTEQRQHYPHFRSLRDGKVGLVVGRELNIAMLDALQCYGVHTGWHMNGIIDYKVSNGEKTHYALKMEAA